MDVVFVSIPESGIDFNRGRTFGWQVILNRKVWSLCPKGHSTLQKAGRSSYARERKMIYEISRGCGNNLPKFHTATEEGKALLVVPG